MLTAFIDWWELLVNIATVKYLLSVKLGSDWNIIKTIIGITSEVTRITKQVIIWKREGTWVCWTQEGDVDEVVPF